MRRGILSIKCGIVKLLDVPPRPVSVHDWCNDFRELLCMRRGLLLLGFVKLLGVRRGSISTKCGIIELLSVRHRPVSVHAWCNDVRELLGLCRGDLFKCGIVKLLDMRRGNLSTKCGIIKLLGLPSGILSIRNIVDRSYLGPHWKLE
jgi:hypothetical protein